MILLNIVVEEVDSLLAYYNVVRVYRATSETGTYSVLDTVTLVAGQADYEYLDQTGTSSHWYKTSYYNTSSTAESSLSAAMKGGALQVPTIASINIENNIRDRIDDADATDYEFDDASITRAIDRAVDEYSRHRPHYLEKTYTVTEAVDTYELPAECVRVTSCDYRTSTVNQYDELNDYYPYIFKDWNHPALLLIRQKLQQAYDDIGRGHWAQINSVSSFRGGQYLLVYPDPDNSTDTFTIRYTAVHPKVSENYATIPSFHILHIEDLAVAYLLRNRARKMDNLPTQYRAGQTMVRRDGISGLLRGEARHLRQKVIDALSEVVIGRG